jgi:hypothetical protein
MHKVLRSRWRISRWVLLSLRAWIQLRPLSRSHISPRPDCRAMPLGIFNIQNWHPWEYPGIPLEDIPKCHWLVYVPHFRRKQAQSCIITSSDIDTQSQNSLKFNIASKKRIWRCINNSYPILGSNFYLARCYSQIMTYGRHLSLQISVQTRWRTLEITDIDPESNSEADLRALIEFAYLDSRRHSISWPLSLILNQKLIMQVVRGFLYLRAPRWDIEVFQRNFLDI